MTQERHVIDLIVAILGTSIAFGFWHKRPSAAAFMAGILFFIVILAALLLKFALGKYAFQ